MSINNKTDERRFIILPKQKSIVYKGLAKYAKQDFEDMIQTIKKASENGSVQELGLSKSRDKQ